MTCLTDEKFNSIAKILSDGIPRSKFHRPDVNHHVLCASEFEPRHYYRDLPAPS